MSRRQRCPGRDCCCTACRTLRDTSCSRWRSGTAQHARTGRAVASAVNTCHAGAAMPRGGAVWHRDWLAGVATAAGGAPLSKQTMCQRQHASTQVWTNVSSSTGGSTASLWHGSAGYWRLHWRRYRWSLQVCGWRGGGAGTEPEQRARTGAVEAAAGPLCPEPWLPHTPMPVPRMVGGRCRLCRPKVGSTGWRTRSPCCRLESPFHKL